MRIIDKTFRYFRKKLYYRQPIYIPGYKYSPWKTVLLILGVILTFASIVYFVFRDIESRANTEVNVKSNNAYYPVDRVIDGDTIDVNINGYTRRIRLIGIDTPETKDPQKPAQCYGKEATAKMRLLVEGKRVQLVYDSSQGDKDKYDRLLRYVLLESGENIALQLIKGGYAREYTYSTPYSQQSIFQSAELQAKSSGVGLWSTDTCSNQDRTYTSIFTETQGEPQTNCDPNYSPCVTLSITDLDCDDIGFSVKVLKEDPHRLDRDGDGYGCESYQ